MTDDRLATEWGDDRLAAAFAARSGGRPTPSDLVPEAIERLRVDPRPAGARFGFAHLGGAAAAAVVLAVVAIAVFGPRPTTEPGETHAATFGLEPITVTEAIAIRDAGIDDRELAVEGWYATAGPVPCPAPPDGFAYQNPTRPWCPMTLTWLMERPERLVDPSEPGRVGGYPDSPAFNPSLAIIDSAGLPQNASTVAAVTFIGHFDDRRAEFCPDDEKSSCVDTFVVDRIAEIDGRMIETTTIRDIETLPASTEAAIDARVRRIDPALRVLSRHVIMSDRIATIEPLFLNPQVRIAAVPPRVVWVVTALPPVNAAGRAVARTFLIPDSATDPAFEFTPDGEVLVNEGAAPSTNPSPSDAAWTTLVGDPISVADAIDHRDNHLDDTELAVRGFAWSPSISIPCPFTGVESPAFNRCEDNFTWIADEAPRELIQPVGVTLRILLRPETYVAVDFGSEPVDVVVLGHFDDHRAPSCGTNLAAQCRRNFIVDAMLDPTNPVLDVEAIESFRPDASLAPIASAAQVERFASTAARGSDPIFAAFPVSGEAVARFEPAASEASELTSAAVVWVVRYIDSSEDGPPVLKTELVIDARIDSLAGSTYVPTRDGLVTEMQANPDCRINDRCEAVLAAAQSVVSYDNARVVVIPGRGLGFHAEVHVCYSDGRYALVDVMGEDLKAAIRDTAWDSPPCR